MQSPRTYAVGKRLKAFTLIELAVVMLLTALVCTLGYMAWGIVQQQLTGYQRASNITAELARMEMALRHDMDQAAAVARSGNTITCTLRNNKTISYQLLPEMLLRTAPGRNDSLQIKSQGLQTTELEAGPPTGTLVQQLRVDFTLHGQQLTFVHDKSYGSALLMQADLNRTNPYQLGY